ncbi:hypothetical protein DSO57_1012621 [Entomophthora muscae]|uniref:Uncharacterized protein n=1 Tax=Entomophthora muscae TaxID=34485 RepID=A0ACC2RKV0_9FUNG|nr:hypothetical protein DSO57_1012621 [Entomophthora muscae]
MDEPRCPPDPIQQANQQQNFANWKEQQKLKDASRLAPAKDVPSPPATDSSRFKKYFGKTSQDPIDSIEASLNSMDFKADVAFEPAPIVEGQNLDFILKALQKDAPLKNDPAFAPGGVDPAIVSLQDPSFFNSQQAPQSRPLPNQYGANQRSEIPPQFAAPFQNDPFSMNVPSGNIPTAVLKQLSNKAPIHLKETSVNLASFLESRDRQHRASPSLPPNHNFAGPPGPSFNFTPHPYGFNANPHYQHVHPSSQSISLDDLFASHRHASVPSQPSYIDPKFASWTSAPANPPFFSSSHPYDYNQRPQ